MPSDTSSFRKSYKWLQSRSPEHTQVPQSGGVLRAPALSPDVEGRAGRRAGPCRAPSPGASAEILFFAQDRIKASHIPRQGGWGRGSPALLPPPQQSKSLTLVQVVFSLSIIFIFLRTPPPWDFKRRRKQAATTVKRNCRLRIPVRGT